MTIHEAAQFLRTSHASITRLIDNKRVPHIRQSGRIRLKREDVWHLREVGW